MIPYYSSCSCTTGYCPICNQRTTSSNPIIQVFVRQGTPVTYVADGSVICPDFAEPVREAAKKPRQRPPKSFQERREWWNK